MDKNVSQYKKMKSREKGIETAGKKAYGIGGAAKVSATESVELDEISKDLAKSYYRKAAKDIGSRAGSAQGSRDDAYSSRRKARDNYQVSSLGSRRTTDDDKAAHNARADRAISNAKNQERKIKNRAVGMSRASTRMEEVELDEKLKASTDMGTWIRDFEKSDAPQFKGKSKEKRRQMAIAAKYGAEREAGMREETENLDEISKKTLGSYVTKASYDAAKHAARYGSGSKPGSFVKAHQRLAGIKKASDKLTKEEVEQLDELSPNTLHSYIKKAAGNMAGNAAVAAAQASSSMKKSSPDVKRKIKNRMQGITGASGRLADKANMAENAWEEVPMMMRQLQFIAYAAEEIMEYLDMGVDPEEWYQNKLASVSDQMETLHAYMEGDKRMMSRMGYDMYGEETELEEDITKMSHGRLKWHMNSGVPHGSYTKDEMKAERDRRLKTDPIGYRSAKAGLNEVTRTALKKTISYTDAEGKSRTRNVPISRVGRDDEGEEKIRESVELTEVFNQGIVKLKDGSSVILKKEDADLLNKMLKDLSSTNRKKMEEVAMKDKVGFNEILGFAREAL